MRQEPSISVSELNRLARIALERALPQLWVNGEIANFSCASSGHWYFTLKDRVAGVRCVMFRNRNQFVDWSPKDGERIEIRAQATLYEGRGDFQLAVEAMRHAGQGAQYEAFLRLKEKLGSLGLFDASRKRNLPVWPRSIGIITSPNAAGLHDVLTTLQRRWPSARNILYPCSVQGDQAPAQIISALELAGQRRECDVLLMVRGGGSLDDLKAFNDEDLAFAIASSPIPIVTGIGHETDFTIADFVADLRAPTPTGAAQLATPERSELAHRLLQITTRLTKQWQRSVDTLAQVLDHLRRSLKHPQLRLQVARTVLDQLQLRARVSIRHRLGQQGDRIRSSVLHLSQERLRRESAHQRLRLSNARLSATCHLRLEELRGKTERANDHLALLNPGSVLQRGFAIVRLEGGEKIVRSPVELHDGQTIDIELAAGRVSASTILH